MIAIFEEKIVVSELNIKAIQKVIDYCYEDERQDYLAYPEDERVNHIFLSLDKVRNWLNEL